MITKSERVELRSLIRQRFKVLRADVAARQAELNAEVEDRIAARFADDDKAWADAMFLIEEAAREANRKANDILHGLDLAKTTEYDPANEYRIVTARPISRPQQGRHEMRRQAHTRIEAQVRAAMLQLDRQEAELLTRLVADALESAEARAFLTEIPTVSALVPADRLMELEQALRDGEVA